MSENDELEGAGTQDTDADGADVEAHGLKEVADYGVASPPR